MSRLSLCWEWLYTTCVDTQILKQPTEKQIRAASDMLKLASDLTRLKVLWALLHGEHSVNELAEHIGAQPPAVSQHLAKLRKAKIVTVHRHGNKMHYEAKNQHMRKAIESALLYAVSTKLSTARNK
jgi:DNA-binding transcriptional ArsR family regulator